MNNVGYGTGKYLSRKRLRDVFICSEVQAHTDVALVGIGGQEDEGQMATRKMRPYKAQYLLSQYVRQADVAQHQVVPVLFKEFQSTHTIGNGGKFETVEVKKETNRFRYAVVVFYKQDFAFVHGSGLFGQRNGESGTFILGGGYL